MPTRRTVKYLMKEWNLLIGAPVEITRRGTLIRAGIVEDAMQDSSLLWVAADGVQGRELFSAADNYEVWVEPRLLDGNMRYRMTDEQLHRQFHKRD
jgi:hypothetical protein